MNPKLWIGLAALVIGALVRAVKTDGASSLLTRLAGREPTNPVQLPTRALPFIALGLGVASGTLDALIAGQTFEDAIFAGLTAAAGAVFGHELLSGVPRVNKVLSAGALFFLLGTQEACFLSPQGKEAAASTAIDFSLCAIANIDLPPEQLFLKCGAKTLEDRDRLMRIVGEARRVAAEKANVAAERARDEAERAAAAGAVGACRGGDAGSP